MLQMKKIIAILLAVCFLVSITAASVSAGSYEHGAKDRHEDKDKDHKKFEPPKKHEKPEVTEEDEEEVTKEVVATLKEVEVDGGVWELHLIKCTKETHHNEKVWFEKKWEFVSDDDDDE
jgi:hypothetical protein